MAPIKIPALLLILCMTTTLWSQDLKKDLPRTFTVSVSNPLKMDRENEMVSIPAPMIGKQAKGFNPNAFVVMDGDREIQSQYNTKDKANSGIVAVLNLKAGESRLLTIRYKEQGEYQREYPKRTQAEISHKTGGKWVGREYEGGDFKNVDYLRVPPEHKDHSWFIRYEGPGWESDKVGYRLYLDQRNATDVFGKKTPDVVLQQVGLDGFDSYHNMQPWGMDVMKVGTSLGIGSIGAWSNGKVTRVEKTDSVTCRILENGNVYSSFATKYFGWKVGDKKFDVTAHTSIHAGTRVTTQTLELSEDTDSLCTGIVKDKNGKLISSKGAPGKLAYLATYGRQSLNSDDLGLAVFFRPADVVKISDDANSHLATLKTNDRRVQYYFLATWVGEPDGIKTEEAFVQYLEQVAMQLANPVAISKK